MSVLDKNGEEQERIALVTRETPVTELVSYFHLLKDYLYHCFIAKWQKEQFDNLVNNLPLDNIICIYDFFEMCHAKGEQEAAGANITQHASLAVLRREMSITSATSQLESVTLKKQVISYVPMDGKGAVPRGSQGCKFKEFQGIRKMHYIKTPEQCKVCTRLHSCIVHALRKL